MGWDDGRGTGQAPPSGGGGLYLKEIELENFKSFGKHLRLPLLPGYTAITGPNGSGKSNLSDAILFVLGPKSGKVIRAGRLTDLIYDGGEGGTPAQSCRVSLVFDNADRTIPLDADEVRLTRYVGRSPSVADGYNSYFYVNGKRANLQAFDDLLAHARISAEGYNMVQQGDVAKVVDMSPVERRRVLEEMAGIAQFDEEIQKAEGKKRGVEEDLDRISIILSEIQRQLKQLEKDRQAALRYRERQEQLEEARAQEAHKEVQLLHQQLESTQRQVTRYTADRQTLREKREALLETLRAAEETLSQREEELAEQGGEEFRDLKEQLDGLRIERARAQDAIERARDETKTLRRERTARKRELEKLRKEVASRQAQREETTAEIREVEAQLAEREREVEALEEEAAQGDENLLELQKRVVSLEGEIESVETEHHTLDLERAKLLQRKDLLAERIAELEEASQAKAFEVKDAQWQRKEAEAETKAFTKELEDLTAQLATRETERGELTQQAAELDAAVKRLSSAYSHLRAEAEAAQNVQKGYNRAVTALLEARDRGTLPGIHGTIAELAKVKPEHEVALKVAAGARMQAIVVEDDETAARAIQHLKTHDLGRAMFLPLNKMVPGRPRGKAHLAVKKAVGFALDLVAFEEPYRNAFWYVFGDTVVVKDLTRARQLMGGVRLVTLDGQLVEASGAMIGGKIAEVPLKFGQVSEGRLAEVGAELQQATEALEQVHARIRAAEEAIESLTPQIRALQEQHLGGRSETQRLDQRLEELDAGGAKTAESLKAQQEELQGLEERLAAVEAEAKTVAEQVAALRSDREAARKAVSASTPQRLSKRLRTLQREKLASREALNTLTSQAETGKSQLDLLETRREEIEQRDSDVEEGLAEQQGIVKAQSSRLAEFEEELLGLQNLEERSLESLKEVREGRDEAFKRKTALEADLAKRDSKLEATEDFLLSLEDQATALQDRVHEAEARVEELGAVAGDLPSLEEIRGTISRCEKALSAIGAVNLRALEDYNEQETRHGELKEELRRLRTERKNLLHLVEGLEQRKKEGLLTVFAAIRDHFVAIFSRLSEGGEAEILLEDEEDPFAGGLIIKARPAGKRFLRLEALSGGEKSLVSMAFIFALQAHDPSPFYFLDEVDQNLDAVNAERIALMIRENMDAAQFIQISLRKVSLKEADHILGVTMTERAISRVIMQVNLDEVVEEGPPAAEVVA